MLYNYTIKFQNGMKESNLYSVTEEKALARVAEIIAEQSAKGNALLTVSIKAVTA